ncbi:MAG: carbamoyltransferase HypF [Deltaproteobacteria bacterium RBG_13_43_22]|nr:MAG: carbamoyltransferase HypF [Deltaproteobacteria bacterium RBG_13_43_22]
MKVRYRVSIQGIVQGVGFRPFVYQQAEAGNLTGYVTNTSQGVELEIEGEAEAVENFLQTVQNAPPPLARITGLQSAPLPLVHDPRFSIIQSIVREERSALISPDMATCPDCLRELRDPKDRRYQYPFINCTNCGPRYTIIQNIPYDRPKTTMAAFTMCAECSEEYHSPLSRRFHAQPNACPKCGPQIFLGNAEGIIVDTQDPIRETARLLKQGHIGAIKGLGGFHLAVDATQEEAVQRLRRRKHREEKPLALMSGDLESLSRYAHVGGEEKEILESKERPIVLLPKKFPNGIAPSVAPANRYFGVMLPYTPMHYLLMDHGFLALVMTSGNLSEEPICLDNKEAFRRLKGIADFFLVHNREIYLRSDDSMVQKVSGRLRQMRRSRGFVPIPIFLKEPVSPVLACGAELKNTVCLTKDNRAFLSQHIGDLENLETLNFFKLTVNHLKQILQIEPEIIAYDLHPDYLSTRYALEQPGIRSIGIQHHFAHMVGCMAEHGLQEKVIGLSLDGTGYGLDGRIWGGEILVGDLSSFERRGHFAYLPMPGGARAIKEPWRMAVSYLYQAYGEGLLEQSLPLLKRLERPKVETLLQMIRQGINSPLTSSCGRLFDGVAALVGLRETVAFEGQAAMELEMVQGMETASSYPWEILKENEIHLIQPQPIIRGVVEDVQKGSSTGQISRRFHLTLIEVLSRVTREIRNETGIEKVVLGGGVFQNRTLLAGMEERLQKEGFRVYSKALVPSNDGGIALGQAVAAHYMSKKPGNPESRSQNSK